MDLTYALWWGFAEIFLADDYLPESFTQAREAETQAQPMQV